MKLTQWSGRILAMVTKTELPDWSRWVVFVVFVVLLLTWFSGIFGF